MAKKQKYRWTITLKQWKKEIFNWYSPRIENGVIEFEEINWNTRGYTECKYIWVKLKNSYNKTINS